MSIKPRIWDHASPSQVKTYRSCHRKWWWEKIVGLSSPGSAATAFGTAVHALLEIYLKGGTPPAAGTAHGRCALPGLRHLPAPENVRPIDVEREFQMLLPGAKVPVHGVIDLVEPFHVTSQGVALPRVTDHKTTSNFKYMKEEEELLSDVQAIVYLYVLITLLQAEGLEVPDVLAFRHVYYLSDQSRKPQAHVVQVLMDRERLARGVERVVRTIDEMYALSKCTNPLDVPADFTHCSAYGGCPFQFQCARAQAPGATAMQAAVRFNSNSKPKENTAMSSTVLSFAERAAARKAEQQKQQGQPPASAEPSKPAETLPAAKVEPPKTEIAQAPANTAAMRAQALASAQPAADAPLTPPQAPTAEALAKMKALGTGEAPFTPTHGINPPDGFPADEQGVLEEQRKRALVATLPDGRKISGLTKEDLVQAHAEMVSTLTATGQIAAYLERTTPEMATWVKSPTYGEKPPGKPPLVVDVTLMSAILSGAKLPALKGPEAAPALPAAPVQVGSADPLSQAVKAAEDADEELVKAVITQNEAKAKLEDVRRRISEGDEDAEEELPGARKAFKAAETALEAKTAAQQEASAKLQAAVAEDKAKAAQAAAQPVRIQRVVAEAPGVQTEDGQWHQVRAQLPHKEFYVNAAPRVRAGDPATTYVETLIAPIQREVAEQNGVDHYLLLDFSRGPKLVAAQLAFEVSRGVLTLPDRLVALRRPTGDPVVEALALLYTEAGHLVVEQAG